MSVATFDAFVLIVFCHCAGEKVRRVAARTVVAAMKNIQSLWNLAVDPFERKAVGAYLPLCVVANHAVAVLVCGSAPRPTGIWKADAVVEKEAFGEWSGLGFVEASH